MMKQLFIILISLVLINCSKHQTTNKFSTSQIHDVLNYNGSPSSKSDKSMLMFSDQGSWFAFSFPDSIPDFGGFTGPFLMTQDNGVWLSPSSLQFTIKNKSNEIVPFLNLKTRSYNSHLEQKYNYKEVSIKQTLVFSSGHTALTTTELKNTSNKTSILSISINGKASFINGLEFKSEGNQITINSERTNAIGHYILPFTIENIDSKSGAYSTEQIQIKLEPGQSRKI